jgi:nucleotide-binding universal stress UspA family protein
MILDTLLVPLDGSRMADRALTCATDLQQTTAARLDLFWTTPDVRSEHAALATSTSAVDVWDGAPVVGPGLGAGGAAVAILDAIHCRQPDLVVMAADSWTSLGLGVDVAHEVARKTPVPILLIPTSVTPFRFNPPVRRIVVALDGSASAECALAPARALADAIEAELVLLRVVMPKAVTFVGPADDDGVNLATARRYVEDLADSLHPVHKRVSALAVVGNPATMISAVSRTQRATMIAMTTRGRSADNDSELGEVSSELLRSTSVPLLLVPPMTPNGIAPRSRPTTTSP